MATLEDKILGEKLHNYCSSSEESDEENSESYNEKNKDQLVPGAPPPLEANKWEGASTNTGPKGVIEDWKKFKQQEKEEREAEVRAKIELAKKYTMTVQSALEEELQKASLEDPELAELLKEEDQYLLTYQKKRLAEMIEGKNKLKFGKLYYLKDGQAYLDAIDKEDKSVTIILHIYDDGFEACRVMNSCLSELSRVYENVKFCALPSSKAGVSGQFKADGVPALLVYKSGNLIGNFVRVSDELGVRFQPEDVQTFLVEHGLIEDKSCVPTLIRNTEQSDDDSN